LLFLERDREEEEEMTNKKISYLCSKCGKTFAGKQSALNHAKDYYKSKNSRVRRPADARRMVRIRKKNPPSMFILYPQ
jgi:DNA-directed RNA polymerase subunit RPC12/RpoP